MKLHVILAALAAAVPGHLAAKAWLARTPETANSPVAPEAAERRARLEAELANAQTEASELAYLVGDLSLGPRRVAGTSLDEEALAQAVERWLAASDAASSGSGDGPLAASATGADGELDPTTAAARVAAMATDEIVAYFLAREPFDEESQLLFQELRESGRIDAFVDAMKARAEGTPEDSEAQADLGHAYLQKLFGMGPSPEAGMLAMNADAAFDRALELDPANLDARFTKAVALANWPPFMGKTDEAVQHFEVLIAQTSDLDADYAEAYTILGSLYERLGDGSKALATWRAGAERFPGDESLARQVELATGAESGEDARPGDDSSRKER